MNTDRDLELGAALRDLPTPEHRPGFWAELEDGLAGDAPVARLTPTRLRTRRFAPRGMWLLSAAAAVVLVVAAVAVLRPDDRTRLRVTPAVTPEKARWTPLSTSPLAARRGQVAVWTGRRMLVWGGTGANDEALADGAAYDPSTDRWEPTADAPTPLVAATAVWTGAKMLVWGSRPAVAFDVGQPTPAGAAYDPATNVWTPISPSPLRTEGDHVAVWTGDRMLVWGGSVGEATSADGASYDPATDRWTKLAPAPIGSRRGHSAVWTGDRMIVWGGFPGGKAGPELADGASYDPASDSWAKLPPAPIAGRAMHAAVWTGGSMVIWGGTASTASGLVADGASYDPATGSWRVLRTSPLAPRIFQTAVGADGSMLVWGGTGNQGVQGDAKADAAAYDPVSDVWRPLPDSPLEPRSEHTAVWTGIAMIVWGGVGDDHAVRSDGAALRPASAGTR